MRRPSYLIALACLIAGLLSGCGASEKLSLEPNPVAVVATRLEEPPVEESHAPSPSLVPEDGKLEISVEEAVVIALERNRSLRVRSLDTARAGAFEVIERGAFRPELFARFTTGEESVTETDRGTGQQFNVTGADASGEIGLRQQLATGTSVEISAQQDRSISDRTPEQQSALAGLTITQSLLRGFGPAVNLASVRQAELNTRASRYELRAYLEALLADVEIAYWDYVAARERIAIFESSLEVAKQQRDEIEERVSVGSFSSSDVFVTRGQVAERESDLVDARAELRQQRLLLARLLNADAEGPKNLAIVPTSRPLIDPEPLDDLAERVELALLSRPDLNESKLRLAQDRLETIVSRNGLLPRLDLFVQLGKTGYADTFRQSFEQLEGDAYEAFAALEVSQFLGRNAAQGRHQLARATALQSAEAISNLEQIVEFDVRLAAVELDRARNQIVATRLVRSYQERIVESEEGRLDVGASTALQVAQARRELLASRIAEVEALVDYRKAAVELYLAEGSLLDRRGITSDS